MRFLASALLAGALLAAPSQAATIYWAYGDSITRGEGLGIVLDPVAGNDCHVAPYPVSKCAYHWRLRDALDAEGITNDVLNRGMAGEATAMGKSRIDDAGEPLETSRCTDPEAGDVLLLMEGTNDISPNPTVSTTTIKMNLEEMIDDATAACVHSVVASVIRRLVGTEPPGSKLGFPNHPETEDLAVKIDQLATDTNRAYVDIWTPLCLDQNTCFTPHYHGKFNMADPGHVDPSGYDIMAQQFEDVVLLDPLPGAATLTGPTGAVADTTPPFTWNEHAHSDWYFLQVDAGTSYGRWHPEEDICTGGVCSFDPGVALSQGDHTWRVRTRNLRGVGSWSATTAFEVWTIAPGDTTAVAPDNYEFFSSAPYQPTYRWNPATNPKEYDLEVDDGVGLVVQETVSAAAVCAGGACSTTPGTALVAGTYTWRVRATHPLADGAWSAWLPFEVSCPATMTEDLPSANESGTLVVEACGEIIAGKLGPYTIQGPNGNVTFHAGEKITIHNGFTVETGAVFTAIVD